MDSVDDAIALIPKHWSVQIDGHWFGIATDEPRLLWTVVLRSPDARYEQMPGQGGIEYVRVAGRDVAAIQLATLPLALSAAIAKLGLGGA